MQKAVRKTDNIIFLHSASTFIILHPSANHKFCKNFGKRWKALRQAMLPGSS